MIRVASYCRVSTDKSDQANSFETQQRYFREYIAGNPDWELYEVYADEGITGTSTKKRIQFNRMISDAYEGKFQRIVTKEVSRFSRNILDTIAYTRELKAIGVGVLFVADRINTLDPEAEMMLSLLGSLAQEESRRTSARVVWGQTRQMEKGVVFGRSLLGYDVKDGHITENPEGAQIVRLIFQKYAVEQMGTSEIARFLTGEGYATCRGSTQWHANTVIKILKNEKYVGDLVQKKTYTPDFLTHEKKRNTGQVPLITIKNHHAPIISREIWELAQARLEKNNKHAAGERGQSNRYVFSGKIRCGVCGRAFVSRYQYRADGTKYRRWCCSSGNCGVGKLVRDEDAMQMLKTAIKSLPMDTNALIGNVTELALTGQKMERSDPGRLRQERSRIRQKQEAVLDAYFSREISKENMETMTEKYGQQLSALEKRLEEALKQKAAGENPAAMDAKIRAELLALLQGERASEVFYKTVLESLTVFKDRHMELRLHLLPQVFWFAG